MKKWCEHWEACDSTTKCGGVFNGQHIRDVNFCPICGTPRPKEQTLAEKFKEAHREYCRDNKLRNEALDFGEYELMAQIAKEHYEKEGK